MSAFSTKVAAIQERVQDLLASMSSRDRTMFIGLVIGAGVLVIGGSAYMMNRSLTDLDSRIDSQEHTLRIMQAMADDYEESSEKSAQIEAELASNTNTDLSAFLEKSAKTTGISDRLDAVKEKSTSSDGVLQEKLYAVSLSSLELTELSEFLYEIETAGFPLKILTMKVKTRSKKGEKTLSVDLDIAAYTLLETEESEG
ncbi:MAG: type II secretory pathway component PulM [Myxococcota bacterium]|jgi:type II secretory pathway component PulM